MAIPGNEQKHVGSLSQGLNPGKKTVDGAYHQAKGANLDFGNDDGSMRQAMKGIIQGTA